MSFDTVLQYGYKFSCKFCSTVRLALITFLVGTIAMFENAGRARAASELARMGRMEEAKALMLEVKKSKK